MAFVASAAAQLGRKRAWGDRFVEIQDIGCVSGDTSGTITAARLSRVDYVIICAGITLTSQPSISNLTVTLAFNDPVATVKGQAILIGQ